MRGFPPAEAFVLLLLMAVIGFGSYQFIHHDSDRDGGSPTAGSDTIPVVEGAAGHHHETELELSFSTTPSQVRLRVLRDSDAEPRELSRLDGSELTNPGYLDLLLPCGEPRTYWLDISWAEPPADGALHFCQMVITASDASESRHTFTTSDAEMNETFTFSASLHP